MNTFFRKTLGRLFFLPRSSKRITDVFRGVQVEDMNGRDGVGEGEREGVGQTGEKGRLLQRKCVGDGSHSLGCSIVVVALH